jgi:hypothetical protein
MQSATRGLITMAFGKQRYIDMAKSLGRSMNAPLVENAVLTDSEDPGLQELFKHVIKYTPELGSYMVPKFHLDRLSPFQETLYVDSDCLALTNLDAFWVAFQGQSFGVPGWRSLKQGDTDPYVDVSFVLRHFSLSELPKFNGGAYYFAKSEATTKFFNTARELLANAKELSIGDFRDGGFSDEPLFALAMAIHNLKLTSMGSGGMWTPINSTGRVRLDAIAGRCSFRKEGRMVTPDIIHFAGEWGKCAAYHREQLRLLTHFGGAPPPAGTRIKAYLQSQLWQVSRTSRDLGKALLKS